MNKTINNPSIATTRNNYELQRLTHPITSVNADSSEADLYNTSVAYGAAENDYLSKIEDNSTVGQRIANGFKSATEIGSELGESAAGSVSGENDTAKSIGKTVGAAIGGLVSPVLGLASIALPNNVFRDQFHSFMSSARSAEKDAAYYEAISANEDKDKASAQYQATLDLYGKEYEKEQKAGIVGEATQAIRNAKIEFESTIDDLNKKISEGITSGNKKYEDEKYWENKGISDRYKIKQQGNIDLTDPDTYIYRLPGLMGSSSAGLGWQIANMAGSAVASASIGAMYGSTGAAPGAVVGALAGAALGIAGLVGSRENESGMEAFGGYRDKVNNLLDHTKGISKDYVANTVKAQLRRKNPNNFDVDSMSQDELIDLAISGAVQVPNKQFGDILTKARHGVSYVYDSNNTLATADLLEFAAMVTPVGKLLTEAKPLANAIGKVSEIAEKLKLNKVANIASGNFIKDYLGNRVDDVANWAINKTSKDFGTAVAKKGVFDKVTGIAAKTGLVTLSEASEEGVQDMIRDDFQNGNTGDGSNYLAMWLKNTGRAVRSTFAAFTPWDPVYSSDKDFINDYKGGALLGGLMSVLGLGARNIHSLSHPMSQYNTDKLVGTLFADQTAIKDGINKSDTYAKLGKINGTQRINQAFDDLKSIKPDWLDDKHIEDERDEALKVANIAASEKVQDMAKEIGIDVKSDKYDRFVSLSNYYEKEADAAKDAVEKATTSFDSYIATNPKINNLLDRIVTTAEAKAKKTNQEPLSRDEILMRAKQAFVRQNLYKQADLAGKLSDSKKELAEKYGITLSPQDLDEYNTLASELADNYNHSKSEQAKEQVKTKSESQNKIDHVLHQNLKLVQPILDEMSKYDDINTSVKELSSALVQQRFADKNSQIFSPEMDVKVVENKDENGKPILNEEGKPTSTIETNSFFSKKQGDEINKRIDKSLKVTDDDNKAYNDNSVPADLKEAVDEEKATSDAVKEQQPATVKPTVENKPTETITPPAPVAPVQAVENKPIEALKPANNTVNQPATEKPVESLKTPSTAKSEGTDMHDLGRERARQERNDFEKRNKADAIHQTLSDFANKNLRFDEEKHEYTDVNNPENKLVSVTTVKHDTDYAYEGNVPEEIVTRAAKFGTAIHALLEQIANTHNNNMFGVFIGNTELSDNVFNLLNPILKGYYVVSAEQMLGSLQNGIAGTTDLILINKQTGKLLIVDYKTEEARDGKVPFWSKYNDKNTHSKTTFDGYYFQLQMYKKMVLDTINANSDIKLTPDDIEIAVLPVSYKTDENDNITEVYSDNKNEPLVRPTKEQLADTQSVVDTLLSKIAGEPDEKTDVNQVDGIPVTDDGKIISGEEDSIQPEKTATKDELPNTPDDNDVTETVEQSHDENNGENEEVTGEAEVSLQNEVNAEEEQDLSGEGRSDISHLLNHIGLRNKKDITYLDGFGPKEGFSSSLDLDKALCSQGFIEDCNMQFVVKDYKGKPAIYCVIKYAGKNKNFVGKKYVTTVFDEDSYVRNINRINLKKSPEDQIDVQKGLEHLTNFRNKIISLNKRGFTVVPNGKIVITNGKFNTTKLQKRQTYARYNLVTNNIINGKELGRVIGFGLLDDSRILDINSQTAPNIGISFYDRESGTYVIRYPGLKTNVYSKETHVAGGIYLHVSGRADQKQWLPGGYKNSVNIPIYGNVFSRPQCEFLLDLMTNNSHSVDMSSGKALIKGTNLPVSALLNFMINAANFDSPQKAKTVVSYILAQQRGDTELAEQLRHKIVCRSNTKLYLGESPFELDETGEKTVFNPNAGINIVDLQNREVRAKVVDFIYNNLKWNTDQEALLGDPTKEDPVMGKVAQWFIENENAKELKLGETVHGYSAMTFKREHFVNSEGKRISSLGWLMLNSALVTDISPVSQEDINNGISTSIVREPFIYVKDVTGIKPNEPAPTNVEDTVKPEPVVEHKKRLGKAARSLIDEVIEASEEVSLYELKDGDFFNNDDWGKNIKKIQGLNLEIGKEYDLDTVEELFNRFSEGDSEQRALADKVFKVAKSLGLKIKFDNNFDFGVKGQYTDNNIIRYNHKFFTDDFLNNTKSAILLHEVIHATTMYILSDRMQGRLEGNLKEAADAIKDAFDLIKGEKALAGEYGLTNAKEMIAELSNSQFRNKLKKVGIWDRITNAIRKLFFFDTKPASNAYEVLSRALDVALDNFNIDLYNDYNGVVNNLDVGYNPNEWAFYKDVSQYGSAHSEERLNSNTTRVNTEAAKQWLANKLGLKEGEGVEIVKDASIGITRAGLHIMGACTKDCITLSTLAKEGTEYHEAWHRVSNLLISKKSRENIYNRFRKQNHSTRDDAAIDEIYAEQFREFMLNSGSKIDYDTKNWFKRIANFIKTWSKVGNYKLTKIYYQINTGKFANVTASDENVKRFKEIYGDAGAPFVLNGHKFKFIPNTKTFNSIVDKLLNIALSAAPTLDSIDKVDFSQVESTIRQLAHNNKIDEKYRNMYLEVYVQYKDVFLPELTKRLKAYSILVNEETDEASEQSVADSNKDKHKSLVSDYIDLSYEKSRMHSISAQMHLILSSVEKYIKTTDSNGKTKYVKSHDAITGFTETRDYRQVFNKLINNLNNVTNASELIKALRDKAQSDPFYNDVLQRLSYATLEDKYVYEKLVVLLHCHKHDFVTIEWNNDNDKFSYSIINNTIDKKSLMYPRIWSSFFVTNTGIVDFNENGEPVLAKNGTVLQSAYDNLEKFVNEPINEDATDVDIDAKKTQLVKLLQSVGITVDENSLNKYIQSYLDVNDDILADQPYCLQLLNSEIQNGLLPRLKSVLDYSTNKKDISNINVDSKNTVSINKIFSKLKFVSNLSKAYASTVIENSESMALGTENKKLYQMANDSFATARTNELDSNTDGVVDDLSQTPYSGKINSQESVGSKYKGPCKNASLVLDQLQESEEKPHLSLETFINFKENSVFGNDDDYFGITDVEDYIMKLVATSNDRIVFPTTADKKTYFFLKGVKLFHQKAIYNAAKDSYTHDVAAIQRLRAYCFADMQTITECYKDLYSENKLPNKDKIANYHTATAKITTVDLRDNSKVEKKLSEPNGLRFRFLTELPIVDPKTGIETTVDLNNPDLTVNKRLELAKKYFFDLPESDQLDILQRMIDNTVQKELDTCVELGIIETNGYRANSNNRELYKNILLPESEMNRYGYNPKDSASESDAVYSAIANNCINTIISVNEVERTFTGDPAFYKQTFTKTINKSGKSVITCDRSTDKIKRLGGLISTGTNCLNYPDRQDYTCTEVHVGEVGSTMKPLFDKWFKNTAIREAIAKTVPEDVDTVLNNLEEYTEKYPELSKAIEDAEKEAESAASSYGENQIDTTDGGAFISPAMYRDLMKMNGKFSDSTALAFKLLTEEGKITLTKAEELVFIKALYNAHYDISKFGYKYNTDEDSDEDFIKTDEQPISFDNPASNILNNKPLYTFTRNTVLSPLKFVAYGTRFSNGLAIPNFDKFALFPLFKSLVADTTIESLYNRMVKTDDSTGINPIDMVMMDTAVKVGSNGVTDFYKKFDYDNNTGTVNDLDKLNVYTQKFKYLRHQLETNPHEKSTEMVGTQMMKQALSNVVGEEMYGKEGDQITGHQIIENAFGALNKLSNLALNELAKTLYNGEVVNKEELYKMILRDAIGSDANDNVITALTNGDSLSSLSDISFVESKIISFINKKTVDVNLPGGAFIQRPPLGMNSYKVASKEARDHYILNNGNRLNDVNEDGSLNCCISITMFKDVIPGYKNKSLTESRNWLIEHNIIGDSAEPLAVGYRIPTQAAASVSPLKIMDVLPDNMGDTIILPEFFTKITGSDFDVDKLYVIRYNIGKDGNVLTYDKDSLENNTDSHAVENFLIHNYMRVLLTENKQGELKNSIDRSTKLLKDTLAEIEEDNEKEAEGFANEYTPAFQLKKKHDYTSGKTGIGPMALQSVHHILTQSTGLAIINTGVYDVDTNGDFSYEKFTNLSRIYDSRYTNDTAQNRILDWFSGLINAFVDIAKDPYITRMNINAYTYDAVSYLLRLGLGKRALYFINNPIIRELAEQWNVVSGSLNPGGKVSWSENNRNIISSILATQGLKYEDYTDIVKSILAVDLMTTEVDPMSRLNDFKIECAKAVLNPYLETIKNKSLKDVKEAILSTSGEYDFPEYNIYGVKKSIVVLFAWDAINKASKDLSELIKISKIDTKKAGNTIVQQHSYLLAKDRLEQNAENGTNSFVSDGSFGLKNFFDSTFITTKINNSVVFIKNLFSKHLITDNDNFLKYVDQIVGKLSNNPLASTDLFKTVSSSTLAGIKSKFFNEQFKYSDGTNGFEGKNKMFYGEGKSRKNSMARRLARLKSEIRAGIIPNMLTSDGKMVNDLLEMLEPYIEVNNPAIPDFIKFSQNLDTDSTSDNNLINNFQDLLEYDDPTLSPEKNAEIRNFAHDLIAYAFYTSGDNANFNYIFKYVPHSEKLNIGYVKYITDQLDSLNNGIEVGIDRNEIFKNNWLNTKVVPEFKFFNKTSCNSYNGRHFLVNDNGATYPLMFVGKNVGSAPPYITIKSMRTKTSPQIKNLYKLVGYVNSNNEMLPVYQITSKLGYKSGGFTVVEYGSNTMFDQNKVFIPDSINRPDLLDLHNKTFGEFKELCELMKIHTSIFSSFYGYDINSQTSSPILTENTDDISKRGFNVNVFNDENSTLSSLYERPFDVKTSTGNIRHFHNVLQYVTFNQLVYLYNVYNKLGNKKNADASLNLVKQLLATNDPSVIANISGQLAKMPSSWVNNKLPQIMKAGLTNAYLQNPGDIDNLIASGNNSFNFTDDPNTNNQLAYRTALSLVRQEMIKNKREGNIQYMSNENSAKNRVITKQVNNTQTSNDINNTQDTANDKERFADEKQSVATIESDKTILSNEELKVWNEAGIGNDPKILVASERTDPAFHVQELLDIIDGKKSVKPMIGNKSFTGKDFAGLYLITKHDGLPMLRLLQTKIPKLIHFSITTLGGSIYEPGIMKMDDMLDRIQDYIKQGLSPDVITIRIDPILPGVTIPANIDHVVDRASAMGIKRFKFSIMDAYPKTRTAMTTIGYDFEKYYPNGAFQPSTSMQLKISNYMLTLKEKYKDRGISFHTCAEPLAIAGIEKEGCLSVSAVNKMLGTSIQDKQEENNTYRKYCTCFGGKIDALAYNNYCASHCIYCYAKHQNEATLQYYNEDGTLKDNAFTRTRNNTSVGEQQVYTNKNNYNDYEQRLQSILDNAPRDNQGRLLAPNGKVSNLNERQYAQVRTRAFKEWFGDWEKAANANRVSLGKEIPNTDEYSKYGQKGETDIEIREVLDDKGNVIGTVRMEFSGKNRNGVVTLHPNLTITGKGYGTALYQHIANKYNINVEESFGEIGKSEAAKRMWNRIYNAVSKDPDTPLRQLTPSNSSKVVDENGEPLVVYHGTNASNITSFSLEKAKHNTGIFLSKSKNVARSYVDWMNADYYGRVFNHELDDFNIYESYDEYKNRTLESEKDENLPFSGLIPEEVFNAKKAAIINFNKHIYNTFVNLRNPLIVDAKKRKWNSILFKGVRNTTESLAIYAKKYGYDGVIVTNIGDNGLKNQNDMISGYEISDEYIALNPTQIKSATDNTGAFDNNNNSIVDSRSQQEQEGNDVKQHCKE